MAGSAAVIQCRRRRDPLGARRFPHLRRRDPCLRIDGRLSRRGLQSHGRRRAGAVRRRARLRRLLPLARRRSSAGTDLSLGGGSTRSRARSRPQRPIVAGAVQCRPHCRRTDGQPERIAVHHRGHHAARLCVSPLGRDARQLHAASTDTALGAARVVAWRTSARRAERTGGRRQARAGIHAGWRAGRARSLRAPHGSRIPTRKRLVQFARHIDDPSAGGGDPTPVAAPPCRRRGSAAHRVFKRGEPAAHAIYHAHARVHRDAPPSARDAPA